MPRLPLVLLTVVLAVGLGWLAARTLSGEDPADDGSRRYGVAQPTKTGRSPAFHLFLDAAGRLRVARQCLDGITSAQAAVLGAVKDDLVLLADDPAVHHMILEDFEQRVRISLYEASGFGDIFARVRHRDFIQPTMRLFRHPEFQVRRKGMEAATVQADPELTPHLDALYREITRDEPGKGIKTLELILMAARACGGDHLPVLLARALECPAPQLRILAASLIRELDHRTMIGRVRPLADDPVPEVRLQALWTLSRFGDEGARARLLPLLDPKDKGQCIAALDAVRDCGIEEAVPGIRAGLPAADEDLRAPMLLTLGLLGDRPTVGWMREHAADATAPVGDRVIGLMGLAAVGHAEDLPLLRRTAREGTPHEVENIARGLVFHEGEPDLELAKLLIGGELLRHPAQLGEWVGRLGDGVVSFIGEKLDRTRDPNLVTYYIACLALVGTDRAREAILDRHHRLPDLVEQQIRLLDLEDRKHGTAREG